MVGVVLVVVVVVVVLGVDLLGCITTGHKAAPKTSQRQWYILFTWHTCKPEWNIVCWCTFTWLHRLHKPQIGQLVASECEKKNKSYKKSPHEPEIRLRPAVCFLCCCCCCCWCWCRHHHEFIESFSHLVDGRRTGTLTTWKECQLKKELF